MIVPPSTCSGEAVVFALSCVASRVRPMAAARAAASASPFSASWKSVIFAVWNTGFTFLSRVLSIVASS